MTVDFPNENSVALESWRISI